MQVAAYSRRLKARPEKNPQEHTNVPNWLGPRTRTRRWKSNMLVELTHLSGDAVRRVRSHPGSPEAGASAGAAGMSGRMQRPPLHSPRVAHHGLRGLGHARSAPSATGPGPGRGPGSFLLAAAATTAPSRGASANTTDIRLGLKWERNRVVNKTIKNLHEKARKTTKIS